MGKFLVLDIEENGEKIAQKLSLCLNPKQRKELWQFFLKSENSIAHPPHNVITNHIDSERMVAEYPLTEIEVGNLYFCLEKREVKVDGQLIKLTVKEFELLTLLIMHPKRVFTYEMLMDLIWHEDYTFYSRKAVNNHVSNLRKKLKISPDIPDYIKSVYGVGYKFEV